MRNFFLIGIFLLLGGALVLFFLRSDDDISTLPPSVAEVVDKPSDIAPTKTPSIPSLTESLPDLPDFIVSSDVLIEKEDGLSDEQKKVIGLKQKVAHDWLVQVRKFMGGVLRLWAVDNGMAVAMNAKETDIKIAFIELNDEFDKIDLNDEEVMSALQSIQTSMILIMQKLSNPPSSAELDDVKKIIDTINPQLQEAYFAIENIR